MVVTGWQKTVSSIMAKVNKEDAVQWYAQNRGLYKKLSEKIAVIITELLEESNLTVHAITNRAKDVDSFKRKIANDKYNDPISQITDFSGIRIIAYVEDDLKPICEIITNSFDIDESNSGDKSDDLGTDKVGYKSIHFIATIKSDRLNLPEYKKFKELKFEVQVRTILQHAWAEIEHDRNYKFNGVLPPEITRRFKILAGSLELIDREFNQLSKEIDKISETVKSASDEELIKIPINSTTLKQFFKTKFKNLVGKYIETIDIDNDLINELKIFGIENLDQLNNAIPKDFEKSIKKLYVNKETYIGILRDIMIINDVDKYFKKCWPDANWNGLDDQSIELYKHYNIDCDKMFKNNSTLRKV
jgi:putative GTP pyrophosphokinase